jgi:amino acid permease
MGVEDIESVFNIVGAICSTSIMILLPTLFYVRLIGKKKQQKGVKYYLSIVIFGVMAPYALFAIIAQQLKSD